MVAFWVLQLATPSKYFKEEEIIKAAYEDECVPRVLATGLVCVAMCTHPLRA